MEEQVEETKQKPTEWTGDNSPAATRRYEGCPRIISASRRTDIPCWYAPWFYQRLKEGFVHVRNARDRCQVRVVELRPDSVAALVFWTKNAEPMLPGLDGLSPYIVLFQYTINGYGPEVEPRIPPVWQSIDTFRRLSDVLGPKHLIWRYDPVFISDRYPLGYHIERFSYIGRHLGGYTDRCVFSFLDTYAHTQRSERMAAVLPFPDDRKLQLAANFASQAAANGMTVSTCAESIDLSSIGIAHGACIDALRIGELTGLDIPSRQHKPSRPGCLCAPSIDIGSYNTCMNLCTYCYANTSDQVVRAAYARSHVDSPLLIGYEQKGDVVTSDAHPDASSPVQLSLFGSSVQS